MTVTVSPWWVWAVCSLALFGTWFLRGLATGAVRDVAAWWQDRRSPNPDYDGDGWDYPGDGPADDDDAPEPLPPELSAEDLGFTGLRSTGLGLTGFLSEHQERRAEPWEAFQRIQYEAMGFEFPSGLMARVRELTP